MKGLEQLDTDLVRKREAIQGALGGSLGTVDLGVQQLLEDLRGKGQHDQCPAGV